MLRRRCGPLISSLNPQRSTGNETRESGAAKQRSSVKTRWLNYHTAENGTARQSGEGDKLNSRRDTSQVISRRRTENSRADKRGQRCFIWYSCATGKQLNFVLLWHESVFYNRDSVCETLFVFVHPSLTLLYSSALSV